MLLNERIIFLYPLIKLIDWSCVNLDFIKIYDCQCTYVTIQYQVLLFLDVYETEGKSANSSNSKDMLDYEFNLWTKHDCHGTQFQNNNRTWFYFGVKSSRPSVSVRFNIVNLNKQVKMFSQGMCPVFKIVPGHLHWERIRERPTYTVIAA